MSRFFEEALVLLHVAEKALNFPNLRPLHDAAVAQLHELQKSPPMPPPESKPIVESIPAETFQEKIEDNNER